MKFLASVFGLQKRYVPITCTFFPENWNFRLIFNQSRSAFGGVFGVLA